MSHPQQLTAFAGTTLIGQGDLPTVALQARAVRAHDPEASILIFDDASGRTVEVDLRGSAEEVLARLPQPDPAEGEEPPKRGRPKLGVVAKEITLLPRHWQWLSEQPGGASVTLRKLVEQARKAGVAKEQARKSQEAAYRFLDAMGGNLPNFEEVCRKLFAGDFGGIAPLLTAWPADVRGHALKLIGSAERDAIEAVEGWPEDR
ncbi:MAG: DUF2239 domain-containing protein [Alphaproteobacteria bacterium CG_4_10_14_0_2_um_filter_63_37]|nr:MAG: hypothetical protein AUJ55_06150 [Proteobacteria bacterium CG1_02_64_396]PJA23844.1 MAG: DUF2239 domain-containing protein [Alphaproteobacteria bacterium CG_4_10_14_0_2_um_filter_63_37]